MGAATDGGASKLVLPATAMPIAAVPKSRRRSQLMTSVALLAFIAPSSIHCVDIPLGAQSFALMPAVAGGRNGARNLRRHRAARRVIAIPLRLVRQRRDGHRLAKVETRKCGIDQIVGRHHDLCRKFVNRLAGEIPELRGGSAR